jgi:hypothetical protein
MRKLPQIVKDVFDAIYNDSWMYVVVWGPPRCGKSTFCMDLMHYIYKDWNKTLEANVFNLSQLLYKMKHGIPETWPTRNGLHNRVPIFNWDDFAAHSGKAKTQHERSWDVFKGAFDTLGTKIGVLLVNMVSPRSPTQQLQEKYTHEVWIYEKGHYKYDHVKWRQDYRGWKAEMHKDWIDDSTFDQINMPIFKQYDALRMDLADEVLQVVEDSLVDTHMDTLVKRVQPVDLDLLRFIQRRGLIHGKAITTPKMKEALIRCKARGLVSPVRVKGQYYKYDITPLGLTLLEEKEKPTEKMKQYQT